MKNPKSFDVLGKWLNGISIYETEKKKDFSFGPHAKSNHFTVDNNKMRDWFLDCSTFLGEWDCFRNTSFEEEKQLNTITRLIIVAFVLLILVGVQDWFLACIGVFILIFVLGWTTISSSNKGVQSKKPNSNHLI